MFKNGVIGWSLLGIVWILALIMSPPSERLPGIFIVIFWYSLTPIMGWINESTDWI